MKAVKAIYDGQHIVLLEPVDLPPNTLLEVMIPDASIEQQVAEALTSRGLLRRSEPPINTLQVFSPVTIEGPPLSQTVLEDRR